MKRQILDRFLGLKEADWSKREIQQEPVIAHPEAAERLKTATKDIKNIYFAERDMEEEEDQEEVYVNLRKSEDISYSDRSISSASREDAAKTTSFTHYPAAPST